MSGLKDMDAAARSTTSVNTTAELAPRIDAAVLLDELGDQQLRSSMLLGPTRTLPSGGVKRSADPALSTSHGTTRQEPTAKKPRPSEIVAQSSRDVSTLTTLVASPPAIPNATQYTNQPQQAESIQDAILRAKRTQPTVYITQSTNPQTSTTTLAKESEVEVTDEESPRRTRRSRTRSIQDSDTEQRHTATKQLLLHSAHRTATKRVRRSMRQTARRISYKESPVVVEAGESSFSSPSTNSTTLNSTSTTSADRPTFRPEVTNPGTPIKYNAAAHRPIRRLADCLGVSSDAIINADPSAPVSLVRLQQGLLHTAVQRQQPDATPGPVQPTISEMTNYHRRFMEQIMTMVDKRLSEMQAQQELRWQRVERLLARLAGETAKAESPTPALERALELSPPCLPVAMTYPSIPEDVDASSPPMPMFARKSTGQCNHPMSRISLGSRSVESNVELSEEESADDDIGFSESTDPGTATLPNTARMVARFIDNLATDDGTGEVEDMVAVDEQEVEDADSTDALVQYASPITTAPPPESIPGKYTVSRQGASDLFAASASRPSGDNTAVPEIVLDGSSDSTGDAHSLQLLYPASATHSTDINGQSTGHPIVDMDNTPNWIKVALDGIQSQDSSEFSPTPSSYRTID